VENRPSTLGLPTRGFRLVVFGVATFLLFQFISLYLSWQKQAVLGGLSVVLAILLNRISKSHVVTLSMMLLSLAATLRYAWWRVHLVFNFFTDEANSRISIDSFLMLVLLSAEAYTICIMVLGFMQTSTPLHRKPVPLPSDESLWPHVDVLIPTYNETLSLVRYTALAAINIDYPPEKLHVYILDDGSREDFRAFCEEAGVGYITRVKHNHAKAGNINHALTQMDSPLITIFDCDHVPTRSFLQFTVGWFLAEKKLAMLQTPHFFYSPDPFERNLLQYKSVPNEAELFYGIIQDGNDFWNATFFCGSCAVIRRTALNEVGGIATETVTEDAHTSLRMQKLGWNTAYINVAQAAGLATETLSAHVGQRVRWARGMIQILRTDNPLLGSGMKISQRLCYFNAMMHFMYAVPRLIFLLAPLAYMLFGRTIIPGYWLAILAYALPHLTISNLTNSRVQGRHRHSFWNEIYETVLAPYILLPTLLALINPKLGSFNVTDKGTTLSETRFDRKIAAPTTWLLAINLLGVIAAPYRLFVLDPQHPGVIVSNLLWILFNMVILGVAAAVAHEQQQRRSSVRIPVRIGVSARLSDGRSIPGLTSDMSVGGASISLNLGSEVLQIGDPVLVSFPVQTGDAEIRSTVAGTFKGELRLQFADLTIAEQETLTRALYSRADSWITGRDNIEEDRPLVSLGRVIHLSFTGFRQVILGLLPRRAPAPKATPRTAASALLPLLLVAASLSAGFTARAQAVANLTAAPLEIATTKITLKDMGVQRAADLHGPHSYYSVHFVLPHTQVPTRSTLRLTYHFSRALAAHSGTIQARLNNNALGAIQSPDVSQGEDEWAVAEISVPSEFLVRDNELTFEFNGNAVFQTGDRAKQMVLASIGDSSVLEVAGEPIPFKNDLSLLPLPLFDSDLQTATIIPFVFLAQPDQKTLQAAGVVASWFGMLASAKPVRFAVSVGEIPRGNVVIFANRNGSTLGVPAGAILTIKTNPSDPSGSALILSGDNDDELLNVARSLALRKPGVLSANGSSLPQGDTLGLTNFSLPDPRKVDDAPRWMPTDRLVSLWNYSSQASMQGDGSRPMPTYFRVPPDLYFGEKQNLPLHVNYRYNASAVAEGSALRVFINGVLINEAPLLPGHGIIDKRREVILPVVNMRPFANTLLFNFDFMPSPSNSATRAALQGAILRDSSLDIRGVDHWARLPDLELFANAGFPFTQLADLGRTVVVLPVQPSKQEMVLFLQLMGHCGTQTGYPALRVQVAGPGDVVQDAYDYLVLGTVANQPAFSALEENLPVLFDGTSIHLQEQTNYITRFQQMWHRLINGSNSEPQINSDTSMPSAIVEGIESPYSHGRSLVVLALRDDNAVDDFVTTFLERSQSSDLSQTVSLLRDGKFLSYAAATPVYHTGDISRYKIMRIWLTEYFWLLLVAVFFFSLVLARWTREYLVRRGEIRLEHEEVTQGL
jgi:cellulose synthase (UDP-forming)